LPLEEDKFRRSVDRTR